MKNNETYQQLLSELTCENCTSAYCFLKKFMESLHPDPRVLIQLKCMEKFKWERSQLENRDIGWNETGMIWALEGWAKNFQETFNEDDSATINYIRLKESMNKS